MEMACIRGHIWGDYMADSLFPGFSWFSVFSGSNEFHESCKFDLKLRVAFSLPEHTGSPSSLVLGRRAPTRQSARPRS